MNRFIILLTSVAIVGTFARGATADDVVFASLGYGRLEKFDTAGTSLGGRNIPWPISIALDSAGNSYLTAMSQFVYRYSSSGQSQGIINPTPIDGEMPALLGGSAVGPNDDFYLGIASNTRRIERFDSAGNSLGMLQLDSSSGSPLALAFDISGNLFVSMGGRIVSFDASGAPRGTFATLPGTGTDIALDSTGNLFVAMGTSVREYNPTGQFLGSFNPGFNAGAIAVDHSDNLYVGGSATSGSVAIIQKFREDGTPLGSFSQLPYKSGSGGNLVTDLVVRSGSLTQFGVPEPTAVVLAIVALCILPTTLRNRCRR